MTDEEEKAFEKELRGWHPKSLGQNQLDQLESSLFAGDLSKYTPRNVSEDLNDQILDKISEQELQMLTPKPLSSDLLDRLDLIPLELELQKSLPEALTSQQLDRFTAAIEESESQMIAEKVIEFPVAPKQSKRASPFRWYASAAAVAIMGALAGFLAFGGDTVDEKVAINEKRIDIAPSFSSQPIANGDLVNVSLNSTVLNTEDRGIIPHSSSHQYYRAMKVVSMETYVVTNERGEKIQVQKPVEKVVMVPAYTD